MPVLDLSTRRFLLPPMHREGRRFVWIAGVCTLLATLAWPPLFFAGLLLTYGVFLFFRDPERVTPDAPQTVFSPADGIVCLLMQVPIPAVLEAGAHPVWRVSVFMSVLDVHVNRMPTAGTIVKMHYIPGAFLNASLDKASDDNERMLYLTRTPAGQTLAFVQIAGLIARRILSFVKEGQVLAAGERFGLIRFGSRVDVYLPPGVEPCVRIGQIMVAGETPIARL
ncbi:MAG: phosphatidylserine decarboxylase [Kiritimatiellae bacterium]|jgi:phosphatidylserine decarboxylase|nr:phosphatidylserine decarboxylase [Kiritimatiellia bacterium]NLG01592.1 phosphatidylserine decarboxylase [Lentisphaerota bacterium]